MPERSSEPDPDNVSEQTGKKPNKRKSQALEPPPSTQGDNQLQKSKNKPAKIAENSSSAFTVFSDVGKILAPALKDNALLATGALVIMFAAVVACVAALNKEAEGLYLFFGLLFVVTLIASAFLAWLYRNQVSKDTAQLMSAGITSTSTVQFASDVALSPKTTRTLQEVLRQAANDVADTVHLPVDLIRANIFFMGVDNRLQIAHNLTYNMNHEPELSLSIPAGYGSTGRCFSDGKPNIAIFREDRADMPWGQNVLNDDEMKKLHPELRWVISIPIMAKVSDTQPIGVLNIDGLQEKKTQLELGEAVKKLFSWSHFISLTLAPEAADGGNHGN